MIINSNRIYTLKSGDQQIKRGKKDHLHVKIEVVSSSVRLKQLDNLWPKSFRENLTFLSEKIVKKCWELLKDEILTTINHERISWSPKVIVRTSNPYKRRCLLDHFHDTVMDLKQAVERNQALAYNEQYLRRGYKKQTIHMLSGSRAALKAISSHQMKHTQRHPKYWLFIH